MAVSSDADADVAVDAGGSVFHINHDMTDDRFQYLSFRLVSRVARPCAPPENRVPRPRGRSSVAAMYSFFQIYE
ncbi:hypothetical protein [Streptomyces sp. NPDC056056]|uniref:hypothetical protein n=1 Tax=Streptomyces sp. NPDC056056 TaxID=3345698 RepID=UPI0035DDC66E